MSASDAKRICSHCLLPNGLRCHKGARHSAAGVEDIYETVEIPAGKGMCTTCDAVLTAVDAGERCAGCHDEAELNSDMLCADCDVVRAQHMRQLDIEESRGDYECEQRRGMERAL